MRLTIPLGQRTTATISVTAPSTGTAGVLVLQSSKDGRVIFRDDAQQFRLQCSDAAPSDPTDAAGVHMGSTRGSLPMTESWMLRTAWFEEDSSATVADIAHDHLVSAELTS